MAWNKNQESRYQSVSYCYYPRWVIYVRWLERVWSELVFIFIGGCHSTHWAITHASACHVLLSGLFDVVTGCLGSS